MFKNLICDLDGTLLDTIFDITRAINEALELCGYSYRFDTVSCRPLMGDGMDMLVRRALKEYGNDEVAFLALKSKYKPLYGKYQEDHTCPFKGLTDVLLQLKQRGMSIFVVTNKPHEFAQIVVNKYFQSGLIKATVGQKTGVPPKPNPAVVDNLIAEYGLERSECIYMGDSHVDVATAVNARMPSLLVTWGYEEHYDQVKKTADYVVDKPDDLLFLLK